MRWPAFSDNQSSLHSDSVLILSSSTYTALRQETMLISLLLVPFIGMVAHCHRHHVDEIEEDSLKCGYSSCPTPIPGKLNVHIVPHSHDDVGWLKTVDQYYYGSLTRVQNAGVQYILDSVVQELLHDPKKKFIYVETAFFWKWWLEQNDHMRHEVKKLVANGQLEFIGGAWSMNDEATTHYQSVIDQFTWGLRKLNDTFGYCGQPKVGWQIDPFGHARETASLMAQMGFDGLFFGRLDYQDKRTRLRNKTMEMIWEGSSSLGVGGDLFTGVLLHHYSTPAGFCWDVLCQDDPMIDDFDSPENNSHNRVTMFIREAKFYSKYYSSNNIMMTFGDDFHYQDAHRNYKNIDKLISRTVLIFLGPEAELLTGALYNFYSAPDGFCFDILCDDDPIIDDRKSPEYNVDMYVQKFQKFADKQSEKSDLFTSALFNEYAAPPGFCFDILCNDDPIIDNWKSPAYNVNLKVDSFLKYVRLQSKGYAGNNILLTMGEDFQYQAAHTNYKNLDMLIRYKLMYYRERKFHRLSVVCHTKGFIVHRSMREITRNGSDIFTGVLYNLYQAPHGFCFDIMCGDEPIIDDKNSPDYNVHLRVQQYLNFIQRQREGYETDNIMITMGGDFNYLDAQYYFKNLDKLMRYVNERQKNGSDVNVFYSTPSCYVKSLNDANIYWPTKNDDFFPYASDQHSYWTGYFTSRPTLKYFERIGNNYLQISKQLSVVADLGPNYEHDLNAMREAMGIMQHHDAITGTEKQHVANDYARILNEAFDKCGKLVNESINRIFRVKEHTKPLNLQSCLLTNISECSISSESKNFIVTVYNPLSRPVDYFVRLPVFKATYLVRHPNGKELENELVPIPKQVLRMPGRRSKTDYELLFKAESLPALGYRSYFISKSNTLTVENSTVEENDTEEVIYDEEFENYFNISNGEISISTNLTSLNIKPSVHYYIGQIGNNMIPENRSSGAYIFRPKGANPIALNNQGNDTVFKGKIVTEVHQTYSEWASHVVRHYAGEEYAEVEWLVGPIPVGDMNGKEVIWRYTVPEIRNNGTFSTDSSGRETIERVKNYRPTWDVELKEPVAGNYYPITTDISINDGDTEVTVIIDRAQGGTSLNSGEVELMVHRRLLHDDAFGVGEALNEVAFGKGLVARGRHWILAGKMSDRNWPGRKRLLQQQKILNSHVLVANADSMNFETWSETYKTEFSGLTEALPDKVQILTLEPWKGSSVLLRLEHIFEKVESQEDVTVNLGNLFRTFDITSIRETTLSANQWLDEATRLKWKKETNEIGDVEEETGQRDRAPSFKVKLRPKEIRTFVCQIKKKKLPENVE